MRSRVKGCMKKSTHHRTTDRAGDSQDRDGRDGESWGTTRNLCISRSMTSTVYSPGHLWPNSAGPIPFLVAATSVHIRPPNPVTRRALSRASNVRCRVVVPAVSPSAQSQRVANKGHDDVNDFENFSFGRINRSSNFPSL